MQLTREQLADLYRPQGVKKISSGNAWAAGGSLILNQQVDLAVPIRGLRFVFKGRIAVATANYTSVAPEGFLNLIPNINVRGVNKRVNGNVVLFDGSLADLFSLNNLTPVARRGTAYLITGSGAGPTHVAAPTSPYANLFAGTTVGSPYDFIVVADLPFHPFGAPGAVRPAYALFEEFWKDTVAIRMSYGNITDNATNSLGVSAATTATTASSYGAATGSMTIDIYVLPFILGSLRDTFTPGVIARASQPISTILQATATNVKLISLEKQLTTRIYAKIGTSGTAGGFTYFKTLDDSILTALGVVVGTNRFIRNREDVNAERMDQVEPYGTDLIQGHNLIDLIPSGNPDSGFPGDQVSPGATFNLTGDVTLNAAGYGTIFQEMVLARAEGPLYS